VSSVTATLPDETRQPPGRNDLGARARLRARMPRDFRTPLACLLLALLPFVTAPGLIIADTKLNLVINPDGFLSRALSLWDPQQLGRLQDQAVGYLFPMGPFFALGKALGIPAWVIQRLWIAALLIAAYGGVALLARRLGIGTPWTRMVAGLSFALSPLALSMLGELSAEFLPMAMLPWILLPLAGAVRGRTSPATGAARSALAVALCSGMNAASTVAVLVPALGYVLTCERVAGSPSRRRLLAWWAPATLLATSWWSIPLALLSKYGVSPVPYTESAAATTSATSLSNVLRGTSDWLDYLAVSGTSWWPLGFRIATEALPVLLTGVIAAIGLSGLVTGRRIAERRFLLCSVLAGVLIIAAGYVSGLGNPLAGPLDNLINGAASPLRNLWKFDPMVRLPVALGIAHLLANRWPATSGRQKGLARALYAVTALAIAGLAVPGYLSGLAAAGSFRAVPPYWTQAADWLNAHAGHQDVLEEPGASFGQYEWGSPLDDVLSPLTSADFAVRDLADIGSPGNQRLLDAIDQQVSAGRGSAGLTALLARMGVKYLVIRNDLDRSVLNGAWPARIHMALAASPGITRVAAFGTFTGSFVPDDAAGSYDSPYPPVEIYQVAGAQAPATVQPAVGTLRVYGGPESLLTIADQGLLGERPVLVNDDEPGQPAAVSVVTDSLRRRARNFGVVRGSYSPTLTATQPADTFEATDDYIEPGWDKYLTVARYTGIADVTASSSASGVAAIPAQWASALQPYAAVDGNPSTMWESGSWAGPVGQWIQLNLDAPLDPGVISASFYTGTALGPLVTQVHVTTAAGEATDPVAMTSDPQLLRVPPGRTGWLRITVTGLASRPVPAIGAQVGIYEIYVPGVRAARTIVAPSVPGPDPAAVVLAKAEPQPAGCMLTSLRWVCSPQLEVPTEEQEGFDHTFTENFPERAVVSGSAILTDTPLADKFVRLSPRQPHVTASSTYTGDPQDQALSAFDGDPDTAWVASPSDPRPTLRIDWGYQRTVSGLTLRRPPGASGQLQLLITGSGGQLRGALAGANGVVRFAPMRTTSLTLAFVASQAPVEISDVDIPGVFHFSTPRGTFRLRCGLGPYLTLNGAVVPTSVTGSYASLLTEQPVRFTACAPVTLAAGSNRLVEPATDAFSIQELAVGGQSALSPAVPAPVPADIVSWSASARTFRVSAPARSYLAVNENFNSGWQAVVNGRTLAPVRLDGWKQAWILPAGTSGLVHVTFGPQRVFRAAVTGGLATLGLVVLAALLLPLLLPRLPRLSWFSRLSWRRAVDTPGETRAPRFAVPKMLTGRVPRYAAACVVLAAAGLWLGGYPGAVILPLATVVFWAWPRPWLARSPVLASLVILASVAMVAGQHEQSAGDTGPVVTALQNGIPQVLLLIVVGILAATLFRRGHTGAEDAR
jgi:arabinofuranan 3-O-arabinosyltransferase